MSCDTCQKAPCTCLRLGPIVGGRLPPCPPPNPCECNQRPCICGHGHFQMCNDVNPNKNCCTMCSGNIIVPNIWFQPGPAGFPGRCILDELTFEQVWFVLLRNPDAKKDLLRITADPDLIELANQTQLARDPLEDDLRATNLINKGPNSLPFYTLFRGRL